MNYRDPTRRGLAYYARRGIEVLAGGTILILLFPFVWLLRWYRARPTPSVPEIVEKRPEKKPEKKPEKRPFVPVLVDFPLDQFQGGGMPQAKNAVVFGQRFVPIPQGRASGGRFKDNWDALPPVKEKLYDTEVLRPALRVVRLKCNDAGDRYLGTGHCGDIPGLVGFEASILAAWGGGTYKVSGTYRGRVWVETVEIAGPSKPLGKILGMGDWLDMTPSASSPSVGSPSGEMF